MRRPTLLDVPPASSLPASTTIRRARVEDAAALAALLGRAYASERWDAAGTEREMFGDETVRATLVAETAGRLIATASLQVRRDAPERGLVRWVATEEDRRREGLARALVIGVLALAQQAGCREALLHTESDRLAAIALYLQLGFEPLVASEAERAVWEQVARSLQSFIDQRPDMDPNDDSRDDTHVRPQVGFRLRAGAYDARAFFHDLSQYVRNSHDSMLFDAKDGEVPGTIRFDWDTATSVVDQAADYLRALPFVIAVFPNYGHPIDAA